MILRPPQLLVRHLRNQFAFRVSPRLLWPSPLADAEIQKLQFPRQHSSSDSARRGNAPSQVIAMELVLPIDMLPQPNDWTCGPTCLHAVYRFWGSDITLDEVIARAKQLEGGGTLAVLLGCDALRHGYQATIYTFNLTAFDPTWFREPRVELIGKLKQQLQHKDSLRLRAASHGYIEFLELGGKILMEDLNLELIGRFLDQSIPIIAGLSSTFLYRESREENVTQRRDDISGLPQGHFVVLRGINHLRHTVRVADPYQKNPWSQELDYEIPFERVICAILLGVLTYDANLLIIHPK